MTCEYCWGQDYPGCLKCEPERFVSKRKRFLLFGWDAYYPGGGEEDVLIAFNTEVEFNVYNTLPMGKFVSNLSGRDIYKHGFNYYQILDMDTGEWSRVSEFGSELGKLFEEFVKPKIVG